MNPYALLVFGGCATEAKPTRAALGPPWNPFLGLSGTSLGAPENASLACASSLALTESVLSLTRGAFHSGKDSRRARPVARAGLGAAEAARASVYSYVFREFGL